MDKPILVIDIGGTTIQYALWQEDELHEERAVQTPRSWSAFEELMQQLAGEVDVQGVSVSLPGAVSSVTGEVSGSSVVDFLFNRPLAQELEEIFNVPLVLENDATCAALAELERGAGRNMKVVAFLNLGTGIGGSYAVNGEIIRGCNHFAGEFGCMFIQEEEHWAKVASPVNFFKEFQRAYDMPEDFTGEDFFALVGEGNKTAVFALDRWLYQLGRGVFNLLVCLDPNRLVIGGAISQNELFVSMLRKEVEANFAHYPLPDFFVSLQASHFKEKGGLVGAALNYEKSLRNA